MNMEKEFAHYIRTDELVFKHAKGIRDIVGKEFHTFHEIFLFLDGEAEFISDRYRKTLETGTLVIIPKECFHQFIVTRDEKYQRCMFNFGSVSGLDELIDNKLTAVYTTGISKEIYMQFTELFDAAASSPESLESRILAKALLARLLCRINKEENTLAVTDGFHPSVVEAVRYIGEHIREPMSVGEVAQALHISESYLMKIFKHDMHMSVYRYITEKRLIIAAGEIEKGVPATKAAMLSGFGDYSGFYKLYKKMFGVSPSERITK